MIYYVPLWMLPLVAMTRAFLFVVKAFFIGVWLTGLLLAWAVRWLYNEVKPRRQTFVVSAVQPTLRGHASDLDDTRVYPSEQTTVELWPGEKPGRVPPA